MNRRALLLPLLLTVVLSASARADSERARTHVVYEGQRLGSIAKRYNVTIEALSRANNIRRTDTIRPGQRLRIPSPGDTDGSEARVASDGTARSLPRNPATPQPARSRSHRVESGQRLESIARRYGITVDALCAENGLDPGSVIRPGQSLSIPTPGSVRAAAGTASSNDSSYRAYFRAPKVKGRLDIASYSQRFTGTVFDKKGRMLAGAKTGVARVLGTSGARPDADLRLIRLLVAVSDRFGGRPIRIVSGYRKTSYFEDSRHKSSRAVDFSIHGVPNEALRDYLRTLPNVGVGYYPNSSFVHLDVREYAAYWVDYAGPGQAPRSTAVAQRRTEEVHDVEPSDAAGRAPTLDPRGRLVTAEAQAMNSVDRGELPATGTSALNGFEAGAFGATRPQRDASPPFALPKARPTLDPP